MLVQETGAPGWAEIVISDAPRILIKVAERDGRWVVANLVVVGEALDSTTLKSIPIARIEALLNTRGVGAALLTKQMGMSEDRPTWLPSYRKEFGQLDDALTSYFARESRPSLALGDSGETPKREPLTRPDGTAPDDFYRRVAEVYNGVVRETSAPAKVLAEEAGVPTATVHRWIFEARRRGFLPPARKGRAG